MNNSDVNKAGEHKWYKAHTVTDLLEKPVVHSLETVVHHTPEKFQNELSCYSTVPKLEQSSQTYTGARMTLKLAGTGDKFCTLELRRRLELVL